MLYPFITVFIDPFIPNPPRSLSLSLQSALSLFSDLPFHSSLCPLSLSAISLFLSFFSIQMVLQCMLVYFYAPFSVDHETMERCLY